VRFFPGFFGWIAGAALLRWATMTDASSAKPRLIFITHEFAPFRGGAATFVEEAGRATAQIGSTVEIWAPDYAIANADNIGCEVVRLRSGGSLRWKQLLQLRRELAARRAQWQDATMVLASVGAHMAFMMLPVSTRVRARSVVSLLYGSEVLRFGRNPLWRWLAHGLYREVEGIVTISEFSRDLIGQSFLSSFRGTIEIAPCACSSDAARSVVGKKSNDGEIRILTLARIHPRKGQLDTARALGGLPPELRRQIVYQLGGKGDAKYLQQVGETCAGAGVAFEYLGEIKPELLAETYAQCDIFAMTSRRLPQSVEGFGITYLDAGFHGKPVVAYRSGGAEEAVLDERTGLLVPEGDVATLTKAFARLIADADLRKRLGNAGQANARGRNWNEAAKIFLRFSSEG
jgi:glycosyltransferase involved in cell wall biosynthesis